MPKNAAGERVVSVAAALKKQAAARGAPSKMIKLRATQRGYYGRPLPDIMEPGHVFPFAVSDLEPAGKHKDRSTIEVDGQHYELPSWCEDARVPARAPAEDEDESESIAVMGDSSDNVI